MFRAGDRVKILASEEDPWAVGEFGRILDDLDPGQTPSELTGGRWTVNVDGWFTGSALCHSHELRNVTVT